MSLISPIHFPINNNKKYSCAYACAELELRFDTYYQTVYIQKLNATIQTIVPTSLNVYEPSWNHPKLCSDLSEHN
jgi:hypothetical protein